MSLSQSSFFCPPIRVSAPKLTQNTEVSIPNNILHRQGNNPSLRRSGKMSVLYNGYSYFTSPCHPLELELQKHHVDADADVNVDVDDNPGIGILKFFARKNIFITGATGLVGKVIVEKILRSTPVGKIYLLMKADDKEAALDRLTKEIIRSDLFKSLEEAKGKSYEAFVREKLIPVVGNICEPNLGMDLDVAEAIRKDVDVIIQSAASTTLNDRYDLLLEANAIAPQRLMRFAKTCKKIKLFAHISTAYVNGRREGMIFEKPLMMGENRRREDKETLASFPGLDIADEIQMAFKSSDASTADVTKALKRLGQERADFFGWFNPYHLTKALGEMAVNEIREDIPLVVIRPSVIESCYKEPSPGWIQGNRVYDPVIISYGKGLLPAYLGDPEVAMNIIPVDIVANATIAAVAKHGTMNNSESTAYHVTPSAMNPLKYSEFFDHLHQYFNSTPLVPDESIERIKFFDNFKEFSEYTREEMPRRSGLKDMNGMDEKGDRRAQSRCRAKVAYAEQLCKMYEFAGLFNATFHTGNSQKLLREMSKEEQDSFDINVMKIDWSNYIQEIHIPGLRKYIVNGARVCA